MHLPSKLYLFYFPIKHRYIIHQLVKRDLREKYKGSFLGSIWALITPLLLVSVYTFAFTYVFKINLIETAQTPLQYAMIVFSGLMVFEVFSECITRNCNIIRSKKSLVKKIIFPVEVLPWALFIKSFVIICINYFIFMIIYIFVYSWPGANFLFVPFLFFMMFFYVVGLGWIISSLGVFFRDIQQVISPIMRALLFLTPIFYNLEHLPATARSLFYLNPIAIFVESFRALIFDHSAPALPYLLGHLVVSALIYVIGFYFFNSVKQGFSNVL